MKRSAAYAPSIALTAVHPSSSDLGHAASGETRREYNEAPNAATASNLALLEVLLGPEQARLRYHGSLHPSSPPASGATSQTPAPPPEN